MLKSELPDMRQSAAMEIEGLFCCGGGVCVSHFPRSSSTQSEGVVMATGHAGMTHMNSNILMSYVNLFCSSALV